MATRYEFKPQRPIDSPDPAGYQAVITLHRTDDEPLALRCLVFSSARVLLPEDVVGADLVSRDGDLHRLQLPEPLAPGQTLEVTIDNPRDPLLKVTDWPYGLYGETSEGAHLALVIAATPLNWDAKPLPRPLPDTVTTVIPEPVSLRLAGPTFLCPTEMVVGTDQHGLMKTAWQSLFQTFASVVVVADVKRDVWPVNLLKAALPDGSYRLKVTAQGAELAASDAAGVHAGLATLVQWLAGGNVTPVLIEDAPRFQYRGLHLDVVRHFMPRQQIEKTLRMAALYKLNRFHWHLTDDEGWRLESTAFPQLTQRVAVRGPDRLMPPQMGSGAADHGGFYRQDEVQAVVALASELGVQVIPELDVPGHARALLRALPELVEAADTSTYRSVQHYADNVLNPGLDQTLTVLKTLLDETLALFPSAVIHLGSDEVPEGVWVNSPAAQQRVRALGLASVQDLHGWLMAELESHLMARGRRAAGWEEITQNQAVSARTIIYSWQGVSAGQAAAQAGHDVVLTPAQHCYLDLAYDAESAEPGYYWAGEIDLATVYGFAPEHGWDTKAPGQLLGLQACLWSELLAEPWQAEYMLLPRLPALAERAWSGRTVQDFSYFKQRLEAHQGLWQRAGWHYRAVELGW
ncbi:MAG: beta-N-acetylhexosaminidase [Natronospirillum sp.]